MFQINTDVDLVITKELLLEKHSEEEYFSFYLGIVPVKGKYYKNPLRGDNHPGCKFFRNKELVFFDYPRKKPYTFIDVVKEKFNTNYTGALAIIANDFGIKKYSKPKNVPLAEYDNSYIERDDSMSIIECETKEFSESELKYWNDFGITINTLNKFNVFSIKHVFINGKVIKSSRSNFPIFGYYFGLDADGIELWKIYMPFAEKGKRFFCNTRCLQGLNKITGNKDVIVVTKSYKDVMALYEFGIEAVAPQGESVILSDNEYKYLKKKKFKYIVFNGDPDRTGYCFMINSLKKYDGIALTFSDKCKYAKDISDYVKKFGKGKAKELISSIFELIDNGFFKRKERENKEKYQKKT